MPENKPFCVGRSGVYALLCLLLMLTGCDADSEYSKWNCGFAYDNSIHQDATLASAMDANSRGVFCTISETSQGGVKYLHFQTNLGSQSTQRESLPEQKADFVLGLNNGIIVGYQTLTTDGFGAGFTAYDVQCPNCVRRENNTLSPHYRLQVASTGIATCSTCQLRYDLNNGGTVQNGQQGDTSLERYVAQTTGPFGHVTVFRKR